MFPYKRNLAALGGKNCPNRERETQRHTLSGHVLCRRRNNRIVTSLEKPVVEDPEVHLCPAIVVTLDDAKTLATAHSEGHQSSVLDEGVDTHCSGVYNEQKGGRGEKRGKVEKRKSRSEVE